MSIQFAGPLMVCLCLASPLLAQERGKTLRATGRVTAVAQEAVTIQAGDTMLSFAVDTSTRVVGKGVGSTNGRLHARQIKIEKKRFRKQ